ncbi:MAG: hypothetical protein RLZZ444_2565 [Pseudomonadota bacterium]
MFRENLSPISRLILLISLIAVLMTGAGLIALRQPSSHLGIATGTLPKESGGFAGFVGGQSVEIFAIASIDFPLPPAVTRDVLAKRAADDPDKLLLLEPNDLVEEPDLLTSYAEINRFRARQQQIATLLRQPAFLVFSSKDGGLSLEVATIAPAQARSFGELGLRFWVQVASAFGILLVASLLVALRPRDWAALTFSLSGLGAATAALMASIYSTRDLALPGDLFATLSLLNHIGTLTFGIGGALLFSTYPSRLFSWRWLTPIVVLCAVSIWLYRSQMAPIELVAPHIPVIILLGAMIVLVLAQFRATRGNPVDRTIMLWLGTTVIVGTSSFVFSVTVPAALGEQVVLSQSIAFIPIAAIYAAIAVGILRYRLFDLGRWAYRLLLYAAVVVSILLVDLVMTLTLTLSAQNSIGFAALVVGFIYFLSRDYALNRLLSERQPALAVLYRQTTAIVFQTNPAYKKTAWIQAICHHFEPIECVEDMSADARDARLLDDGLGLQVPGHPWAPALRLRLARRGKRLFDKRDIALVEQMADLVRSAEEDRKTYEQGVQEERQRIAMDLHDDVGATLLSGLHATDEYSRQETIIDALSDIRQIAGGLAGRDVTLSHFIAHLRHETRNRAELHGFTLDWPLGSADESDHVLPYSVHRNLSALHREAISNALKYGRPGPIRIRSQVYGTVIAHEITNETDPDHKHSHPAGSSNLGSGNMRLRALKLNGTMAVSDETHSYRVRFTIPIDSMDAGGPT